MALAAKDKRPKVVLRKLLDVRVYYIDVKEGEHDSFFKIKFQGRFKVVGPVKMGDTPHVESHGSALWSLASVVVKKVEVSTGSTTPFESRTNMPRKGLKDGATFKA